VTTTASYVGWRTPDEAPAGNSDLAATVMLSGADWEQRGAQFSWLEDGEGEMVRSAHGTCATSIGDIAFRVWDYGDEPVTYLLVEGQLSERPALAELVVAQMRRAGVLPKDVEVALFADHKPDVKDTGQDDSAATLEVLLDRPLMRAHTAYARTLRAQRNELLVAAARDLIAVPIALVVTVGITIGFGVSNWGLSLAPRIGLVTLGALIVVPLLVSVASLLRLSIFRHALADSGRAGQFEDESTADRQREVA
jgi:hypothetical protein